MRKLSEKKYIVIFILVAFTVLLGLVGIYRFSQTMILDKTEYKNLCRTLEKDAVNFTCQNDLKDYITDWADSCKLDYSVDANGNIIFVQDAAKRKKNFTPTVIVVSYNYENAESNRRVLASAAMIAKTALVSGEKIVVFVNNEFNDGSAYRSLNSVISNNAKVIYLDYGKGSYVSTRSFAQEDVQISIDAHKEPVSCDTSVRIRIGGITSDLIEANVNKHINPINLLSTVLTRLKSKSTICQISDINVENQGYKFPTAVEATILLNSYSVDSFVAYLDKRIKVFDKSVDKDANPNAYYEYEILEPTAEDYPAMAYDKPTFDSLVTVLYAVKNGIYRYDEKDDNTPEDINGRSIYGINCLRNITAKDDVITLDITSQGADDEKLEEVANDNRAAAELSDCNISMTNSMQQFDNNSNSLAKTLQRIYLRVNDITSESTAALSNTDDTYFTPMTFLRQVNDRADIVHVKLSKVSAGAITNMLLCYIKTKGNLF